MACFAPQETSDTRLSYIKEVDCALPGTPELKELRKTSWGLVAAVDNVTSEEINSTRQVSDRIPTGGGLAGPMGLELSYKEYDPFMAAALQSAWIDINETIADFEVTANNTFIRTTGSFVTDGLIPGVWIKTSGFTNAANNDYFKVLTVAATTITVESAASATPLVVEAAASRSYKASWIKNESTKASFYFELYLQSITGDQHLAYNNVEVNNMNLDFTAESVITGSFDFLGVKPELIAATVDNSGTPSSSELNDVMNTTSNVSNIRLGGSLLTATYAQNFTLATTNNMAKRPAVGAFYGVGQLSGEFEATGSLNLYMDSAAEYENWLNNTARSLDWRVNDAAGNTYILEVPRFKWTDVPLEVPGKNQDVFLSGTWGAVKDPTTGVSLIINRFDS